MAQILSHDRIISWRKQFDDKGFVTLSSILNKSFMIDLRRHVDAVFDPWFELNQKDIVKYGMVNMHSLTHPNYHTDIPATRVLFYNAISPLVLVEAVNAIFGADIHFHNTQLFFNPLNETRLPYWHRDMQYNPIEDSVLAAAQHEMTSLHLRIPLIDESGVELIPGSHNRWDSQTERKVRLELDGHQNTEDLPGSELVELNVGDVLIFDAQMMHRGNYELNDERKALDLCVGKYHELSAPMLNAEVLPDEHEILQIKNPQWFVNALQLA